MALHSSNKFDYNKASRSFTTEVSMLGSNPFGRVYEDSCDEGLTILSYKTGLEASFVVEDTKRDREGDVTCWIMKPTAATLRKHKQLNGVELVVFNT